MIGIQFKRSNAMKSASGKLEQLFKSRAQQIAQWSISTNEHALAQPGNLYIKGVPKDMSMDQVVPMFSKFGPISSFKLIRDSVTGKSLGYGLFRTRSVPMHQNASLSLMVKLWDLALYSSTFILRGRKESVFIEIASKRVTMMRNLKVFSSEIFLFPSRLKKIYHHLMLFNYSKTS